jgi:hypothetical protein
LQTKGAVLVDQHDCTDGIRARDCCLLLLLDSVAVAGWDE